MVKGVRSMLKCISYIIGLTALFFNSLTTASSCFWFAYEPEFPQNQKSDEH
ncbi:AgrD family cyclic lactone autoinducer peptide [Bacillus subtilis]